MKILKITLLSLMIISFIRVSAQLEDLKYRNVGPLRGGRVTAVAGTVAQPGTFVLGATGGGVWKTTDYGTSWENISDGYFETPSIGAIGIDQKDPNIIYVGTGTDGIRSNVIVGKGMYKSIDGGETWQHIGLRNAGQIGEVIIHPDNYNIVYVAALGQPFSANPERGIYKTTDGGRTWNKILFVNDEVGFYDVEFLPGNPSTLFATAWKAKRTPWNIISGGSAAEGGIYKSVDDGKTWNKITKGLPSDLIGKIDVAVTPADSKIIYALLEAPEKEGGLYISIDQGESFKQVSDFGGIRTRHFYYTNLKVDPKNPDILYGMATGNYKSSDGGKSWQYLPVPHGDNHDMWIDPNNPNLFIQSNDGGANITFNGGKTWSSQFNQPTSEIYQVAVDNQYPYWLYGGQQDNYSAIAVPSNAPYSIQAPEVGYIINVGGCETGPAVPNPENPNIVYSNCKGRFTVFNKITGQEQSYNVGAAYMYGHNPKDLKYRFQRVSPIHVSPNDAGIVYHTSQYVHRTKNEGKTWEIISPDLTAFEDDKQVISGTPITRDITGEEYYSTIYSIRESTAKAGVIWTGANDGPIYVTKDHGENWTNVTPPKVPKGGRVDAVEPSPHDPAKAYAAILRYQLGDPKPYIVKTTNYGKSWEIITNGIPADYPVRVVREHPNKEGLLFAGTEYGMFISYDDGKSWESFQQNLPVTPITDIKIHRNDLVLSTMGRGFWIMDNVSVLTTYDASSKLSIYTPESSIRYRFPRTRMSIPEFENGSVLIDYFLPEKAPKQIKLEIMDDKGKLVNTYYNDTTGLNLPDIDTRDMATNEFIYIVDKSLSNKAGLNRFSWDMEHYGPWNSNARRRFSGGPIVAPGSYTAKLTAGAESVVVKFELVLDPRVADMGITKTNIDDQVAFTLKVAELVTEVSRLEAELEKDLKKADGDKKVKIEAALKLLQSEDITYPMPKLVSQIQYLYRLLDDADQIHGKDVKDRYKELKAQLAEVKAGL